MNRPKVAIYIRQSWDEPAPRMTSQEQERQLRDYCLRRGYDLAERYVYKDIAFPGTLPVEKRPSLERLFNAAKHKRFDIVIVLRLDRLFRNYVMLSAGIIGLVGKGVNVQSVIEGYDTSKDIYREALKPALESYAEVDKFLKKYDKPTK